MTPQSDDLKHLAEARGDGMTYKIGDTVLVKKVLKTKKHEQWRSGTIHHTRKYDEGDRGITIKFSGGSYLHLINDAPAYCEYGSWRKLNKPTIYVVKREME